ncbi:MAG TPA: endonuclease/exonuclease/phosphatase family protein [Actinophytocola sp.]|uniref:endonuclease/exonuclease/phosphatase family protein n=1 Tax=Actinophytocola sp. TaxID=1872138 RepID=UPI002DBB3FAE|nr:endonuclease/exonuclease/phosphatase family protein [Actinophytocola sp.]HEU5471823.1 endonuclease/exonuclease/phosphatase family protein [Actinophytocola sp.]
MLKKPADRTPEPKPERGAGKERRPKVGGRRTTAVLGLFTLVFLGIAVLRVLGVDGAPVLVAALTLTPYIAAAGLLLALVAFLLRRRALAAAVLVMALSMVVLLVPRYFSDAQPPADGERLRVMAADLNAGRTDPATVLRLAREQGVDVLTLPELTQEALEALDTAGLAEVMPYRAVDPRPGGNGSGIVARLPLRQTVPVDPVIRAQVAAVVDLPGRDDVEVLAAHVVSVADGDAALWRAELARLPAPQGDRVRVLAGDFAATFDHASFRRILDPGYADAAEQTGEGLTPTWMSWPFGPPATMDHILVDARCAVASYAVFDLPGGDHRALLAEIVLP